MSKNWIPKKQAKQTRAQKRWCREAGAKGKEKQVENTARNIERLKTKINGMELK